MTSSTLASDESLYRAYRDRGDEDALRALLERHWAPTYHLGRTIVRDPGAAEDVAQEAFASVLTAARQKKDLDPFAGWLRRVTVNQGRMHLRARGRRERREEVSVSRARPSNEDPGAAIREYTDGLEEELRLPLFLHYGLGLTHGEMAAVLGCPQGSVSARLRAGLERIRAGLGLEGAPEALEASLVTWAGLLREAPAAPSIAALAARSAAKAGFAASSLAKTGLVGAAAVLVLTAAFLLLAPPTSENETHGLARSSSASSGAPAAVSSGHADVSREEPLAEPDRAGSGAGSSVAAATTSVASGSAPAIVVLVRDRWRKPVANAEVTFRREDPGVATSFGFAEPTWHDPPPILTDGNGLASLSLGPRAEPSHPDALAPGKREPSPLLVAGNQGYVVARSGVDQGWSERIEIPKNAPARVEVCLRAPEDPVPGRGAITGRVTSAGKPISNVVLRVEWGSQAGNRGDAGSVRPRTDADGRYALHDLLPGGYRVELATTGFAPSAFTTQVAPGEVSRCDVELERGSTLTGRVIVPRGERLNRADDPDDLGGVRLHCVPCLADTTNVPLAEGGTYRAENVRAGRYRLTAMLMGYLSPTVEVEVPGNSDATAPEIRFAGCRVSGRVVSPRGDPVPGVVVTLRGFDLPGRPLGQARTDERGSFAVQGMTPGRYQAAIWGLELQAPVVFEVGADDLAVRDVVVVPKPQSGTVTGRVVGPSGDPVASAHVVVSGESLPRITRETDVDGRFSVDGVPSGEAKLFASAGDLVMQNPVATTVVPGATASVVLKLERASAISGRVLAPASRLASGELEVILSPDASGSGWATSKVGADGGYRFAGLRAGHYALSLFSSQESRAEVDVGPAGEARCDLSIGAAVEQVQVTLDAPGGYSASARASWKGRPADLDGSASVALTGGKGTLSYVQPGAVTLEVTVRSGDKALWVLTRELAVDAGSPTAVALSLPQGAAAGGIGGRVDAATALASSVGSDQRLEIVASAGDLAATCAIDAEGTFRLGNLHPGHYRVYVHDHEDPDLGHPRSDVLELDVAAGSVASAGTLAVSSAGR